MSKLYWMDKVIASTDAVNIAFTSNSLVTIPETNVNGAINYLACNKTGIHISTNLQADTSSVSFTDVLNFRDNMFVDAYCDHDIKIKTYNYSSTTKTITYTFEPLGTTGVFTIVVTY